MSQNRNHPYYNSKKIRSLAALSKALKIEESILTELVDTADQMWKPPYKILKEDGSFRIVNDAKPRLKALHKRILSEILSRVEYPSYITGSLKGHDYSTNAEIHANKAIVVTEDIKSFFPSTSVNLVLEIWEHFFGFSRDVAEALTKLTTKDGCLPQGGICSSYLANLAFWDLEGDLYASFKSANIDYSRYVDDITISSTNKFSNNDKSAHISSIYGILLKKGYKAKRSKHEIQTKSKPIIVTKLVVNDKVSLTNKERDNIRSAVYQLEKRIANGERGPKIATDITKTSGRIGVLTRFHKADGLKLKLRVKKLRDLLKNCSTHNTTLPSKPLTYSASDEAPF